MTRRSQASSARGWRTPRFIALVALIASLLTVVPGAEPARAQGEPQTIEVWGISSGIVDDPKEWKYRQSVDGDDLGSHSAADPALDDSAWETRTLRWREIVGSNVANHFRKDFDLADIGVAPFQVVGIQVRLQYDDAAVMYLNGEEVYRSIRGNLLPDFAIDPPNTNMPFDVPVTGGGYEEEYTNIPDPEMVNTCEEPDTLCANSPYGSPHPPAVPIELLVEGTNTWSVTTWNQSGGGSGDSSLNHVFELIVDFNALPPPNVEINEVMASNVTTWQIQLDEDPELETPDWFELRNLDTENPTDISGWTIADQATSWVFPTGTSIPAGGYLVVAANDGDDPTSDPLQTNFQLSSRGDELKLTTDQGVVADLYEWSDQFTDNSFGRPGDTGDPTYLASPTLGATNDVLPLVGAPPFLRYFRDRMYNPGEPVDLALDAFDPDGDPLAYEVEPLPAGVILDPATGLMSGTADLTADVTSLITVTDGDDDTDTQSFTWFAVDEPPGPSPIVLNEYNAVPSGGELNGGSEIGNGGDWFEFLVVEDNLDLRGYTIEFRQRDGDTDELRTQVFLTFADRQELGAVPAGTIITIAEIQGGDDLSFDGVDDWSINLRVNPFGVGAFFDPPPVAGNFNSTRRDQTVLIRDASGDVVTPLAGETDGWDAANGGVNESEVMNLCRDMLPGGTLDPVVDYRDNGTVSTFGDENVCVYPDPENPGQMITEPQDLAQLRASATFGAQSGDVNCDRELTVVDALLVAQFDAEILTDSGPCFFSAGGVPGQFAELAGDFNGDGETNVIDALLITRCRVGLPTPFCPPE